MRWPKFQYSLRTFLIVSALIVLIISLYFNCVSYYAQRAESRRILAEYSIQLNQEPLTNWEALLSRCFDPQGVQRATSVKFVALPLDQSLKDDTRPKLTMKQVLEHLNYFSELRHAQYELDSLFLSRKFSGI